MGELVVGEFRKIAEGVYLEGLSYDFKRDVVWYSDPLQGGVFGVTPDGISRGSFNLDRRWTGGVMMNADGSVLSSGPGGIMWNNPDTGESGWLLQEISGKPINGVNEMWPDGTGGIFFGTNDIEMIAAARDTRPTAVYRLTQDRDVITLDDEVFFSNGLAYDWLRQRFYCNDTFRTSWAWDVRDNPGQCPRHWLSFLWSGPSGDARRRRVASATDAAGSDHADPLRRRRPMRRIHHDGPGRCWGQRERWQTARRSVLSVPRPIRLPRRGRSTCQFQPEAEILKQISVITPRS